MPLPRAAAARASGPPTTAARRGAARTELVAGVTPATANEAEAAGHPAASSIPGQRATASGSAGRAPADRLRPRTGLDSGGDGDPALPAAPGALPRDRPATPHLRRPLSSHDPALPRYRRAVRRGADPRRPRDR